MIACMQYFYILLPVPPDWKTTFCLSPAPSISRIPLPILAMPSPVLVAPPTKGREKICDGCRSAAFHLNFI